VSRYQRTLQGEGHSAAGWGIGGSVWLQTAGSKVRLFGQWAVATCAAALVSLPVSTPLRIVKSCWPGYPCKWQYINVEIFNLLTFNPCWARLRLILACYIGLSLVMDYRTSGLSG